jgi:hypothetical protein
MCLWRLVLLCLLVSLPMANSAQAEVQQVNSDDSGCTDVYTGTSNCFVYGADGAAANGGTAGGMTACTATSYCVACERPLGSTRSVCVEARRNASCKCVSYTAGALQCATEGACTYRRS